jgi:dolichol kinase
LERWAVIRRTVHVLIAVTPLYYLLPDTLPYVDLHRSVVLLAGAAIVGTLETARLTFEFRLPGLRPYEERRVASYAWAAAGVLAALWLLPEDIASASIVGMAFTDPLIGELRSRGFGDWHSVSLPFAVCVLSCASMYLLFAYRGLSELVVLSAVGALAAVGVERWKNHVLDDDFLMIVVPGAIASALAWAVWG